jgi:hypothetical protein
VDTSKWELSVLLIVGSLHDMETTEARSSALSRSISHTRAVAVVRPWTSARCRSKDERPTPRRVELSP